MPKKKDTKNEINQKMMDVLNIKNIHALPKIKKIVINFGIGKFKDDKKGYAEIKKIISFF